MTSGVILDNLPGRVQPSPILMPFILYPDGTSLSPSAEEDPNHPLP